MAPTCLLVRFKTRRLVAEFGQNVGVIGGAINSRPTNAGLDDEELIFAAAQEFQELNGYAEEDECQSEATKSAVEF